MGNIEQGLNTYSLYLLVFGSILLIVFALVSLKIKKLDPENKKLLYLAIIISAIIPTLALSFSTVYLNVVSSSGGPVHWHADFEVWNCGQKINLKDPKGFSNRIGTRTLHEHGDDRIHLEGLVITPTDANLSNFFRVVGGDLTTSSVSMPINDGTFSIKNGDTCVSATDPKLQVFAYKTDKDNYYSQKKIENPADYIISAESNVPPADCIIIEYDTSKAKTDKLCRSYKVAQKIGKLKGEKNGN